MKLSSKVRPLMFARDSHARQECKTVLKIDYKDSFYVQNSFNWTGDVIPTNAENEAFSTGEDWKERKGMIVICTEMCDWGECPKGHVDMSDIESKTERNGTITEPSKLSILVNEEPVVGATIFLKTCFLLSNKDGYIFPPSKNAELKGQYDIKFRVHPSDGFLSVSSIIVV